MIVTLRRTFASSRMTAGQLSMGDVMASTIEPPLKMFQSRGQVALPEGQYPLTLSGDDLVIEGTGMVLGRQIRYGLSSQGAMLLRQPEAAELFQPSIAQAITMGDDVLLDVIDPR